MEKAMKNLIRKYNLKFGYSPTLYELYSLYTSGSLILSDKEEDVILHYIELTT